MKITIIGASRGVGLESMKQALAKGHNVTVLTTNTQNILPHPLLTVISGSATSVPDIKKAIKNSDAVLITVGTKKKKGTTLFSDTATALIKAADDLSFSAPVLVITGFGAGESYEYASLFMRTVIRLFLKDQYSDKTLMEDKLANSKLNWQIIRPGMLTNGPLTNKYKVLSTLKKGIKVGKISRADVADFMLKQVENPTLLSQYPALTN
jgi:putative NADH-flavin reductase